MVADNVLLGKLVSYFFLDYISYQKFSGIVGLSLFRQ
jgi:uncharacterized membrane protein YwzB